jgi:hypothetical protein
MEKSMAMSKLIGGTAAALAATFIVAGGVAQVASADSAITIRQADLIGALSDTRSAGHVTFLSDGLHVWTDDSSSQAKAAEYFNLSGPIPTSASLDWYGTDPQPGQQIVFDVDGITGNGNDWNILVGEPVYGGNWWLTNGSSADAKAADPSGANDGGNGSAYFGTLTDWANALPNARVYAGGFSLGSGVKGNGVIDSITYSGTQYRFTKTAALVATNVTGHSKAVIRTHAVRLTFVSNAQPAGTVLGSKLAWQIKVDNHLVFGTRQGFGERVTNVQHFQSGSGQHVIDVYKNGTLVRHIVRTF